MNDRLQPLIIHSGHQEAIHENKRLYCPPPLAVIKDALTGDSTLLSQKYTPSPYVESLNYLEEKLETEDI